MKTNLITQSISLKLHWLKSGVQSIINRPFGLVYISLLIAGLTISMISVGQDLTFTVNSTGDEHDLDYNAVSGEIGGIDDGICDVGGGKCTFRAAIENHRKYATNPGVNDPNDSGFYRNNSIVFNIELPQNTSTARIIVTDFFRPILGTLLIDGTTQPGYIDDPVIELDGTNAGAGAFGLWLVGRGSLVRGLNIHSFDNKGIVVSSTGGGIVEFHTIDKNYIGTDYTGTQAMPNKTGGILILNANTNTIRENIISGNGGPGLEIDGNLANNNIAENNRIGVNKLSNQGIPNFQGILMHNGATNNTIDGNIISGNNHAGISINGMGTNNNSVYRNKIGTNTEGNATLENSFGILIIDGAKQNSIGGPEDLGNLISGNAISGITITGAGTDSNLVVANTIGCNEEGDDALPNRTGVEINGGARSNQIGRSISMQENLISGNLENGVWITGSGTDSNLVVANIIGPNREGNMTISSTNKNGVVIESGAKNNEVDNQNLISGNKEYGVLISGTGTQENRVSGNNIGTNMSGDSRLSNLKGVVVRDGARINAIGSSNLISGGIGSGNLVSGNEEEGILITGANTDENFVSGNTIGTNKDENANLWNTNGVVIKLGAKKNEIAFGNLISGNLVYGVLITDDGTDSNSVWSSRIGADRMGNALTNRSNTVGVGIEFGAKNNEIGGAILRSNIISYNEEEGVRIQGANTDGNRIWVNSIFNNKEQLGIDLENDGRTLNDNGNINTNVLPDLDQGPNNLQNYPELSSVSSNDGNLLIQGVLRSTPNNLFRIELFSNTECDPSGFGEGQTFLESRQVSTDVNGIVNFNFTLENKTAINVTATATNITPDNLAERFNTSEFSECEKVLAMEPSRSDIQIVQTSDKTSLAVGENITFTVKLINSGPGTATGVAVRDQLPAGFAFSQATASIGSYDNITGIWTVSSLGNGNEATLVMIATAIQAGSFTNTAELTASDQKDPDSAPDNGVDTEDDQSSITITIQEAVTIEQQIIQLKNQVADLVGQDQLSRRQGRVLTELLNLTLKLNERVFERASIFTLKAFMAVVRELVRRHQLAAPDGQALLGAARNIINQLEDALKQKDRWRNVITEKNSVKEQPKNEGAEKAVASRLYPNAPNPFSTNTTISFELAKQSRVQLVIYDEKGGLITQLLNQVIPNGKHYVNWQPKGLSAGVYFLQLKTDHNLQTQRMVLVK